MFDFPFPGAGRGDAISLWLSLQGRFGGPFFAHRFFNGSLTLVCDIAVQGTHLNMGAEFQIEPGEMSSRLAERRYVEVPVRVRRPGENWFKSCVADLSVTGFRLQSFMKLTAGDGLWVMLPGFEGRRAQVLWTRGHEAGCRFERPLHPAILDHIIRMSE